MHDVPLDWQTGDARVTRQVPAFFIGQIQTLALPRSRRHHARQSDSVLRRTTMKKLRLILTLVLGLWTLDAAVAAEPDSDGDGLPDRVEKLLGTPPERAQEWTVFWTRDPKAATGKPGPQMLRAAVSHVAEDRFVWRVDWSEPFPAGGSLLLYLDADNRKDTGRQDSNLGTDLMYHFTGTPGVSYHNETLGKHPSPLRGEAFGNSVVLCHDAPLHCEGDTAVVRVALLAEGAVRGSTGWIEVRIPLKGAGKKPHLLGSEDAEFPGLSGDVVRRSMTGPYPERRPHPVLPFVSAPRKQQPATAERERVTVELAEDDGIARQGVPVRFGFPLPQGKLFNPAQARLLAPDGREVPAQFIITGFWKDDSIRWMAVTFLADIAPKSRTAYAVEFGRAVKRRAPAHPLRVTRDGDALTVNTGAMEARLNARRFGFLDEVRAGGETVARGGSGLVLTTRDGRRFTSAAGESTLRIEEEGPLTACIRIEGPLNNEKGESYFRHITRLRFYAGSAKVDAACTLLDDSLEHEFADFRSVELTLENTRPAQTARFALADAGQVESLDGAPARLFQRDDQAFSLTGASPAGGRRAPGRMAMDAGRRGLGVAVEDFWQNYPCALRAERDKLAIEFWPDIRGETRYSKLPDHLRFPFVEGAYRFKWGMSRTRRVSFDFAMEHGALPAPAEPLVMVVPPAWYESSGALGPMVARHGDEYAAWDTAMEQCFADHLRIKEAKREYGFFNWGDWHGEREINWGNNEYDLPHALFMQFARTGDRRYFHLALEGARHQADVDCVHAYPDPAYVGCNVEHSVSHTGTWSEKGARGWSYPYSGGAMATNGHTWSEGMCDAWHLAGDERPMEAAQGLGEHIVYGMVPRFKSLGTHERSAGWSLIAILAIYRATLDPLYLDAAQKIAEVPLRERKPGQGSGWPHKLPGDHCAHSHIPGAKLCVGNACFLMGILGSGLKEYYVETGDARAREAVIGQAAFWKQMWIPEAGGFPYTSCPLFRDRPGTLTGMLCADAIAFAAKESGDKELMSIAAEAVIANIGSPYGGDGKGFAQYSRFAAPLLATLRDARDHCEAAHQLVTINADVLLQRKLAKAVPTAFLGIRAPKEKQFFVQVAGGAETIVIKRKPHGSMSKAMPTCSVTVTDPEGREIRRETFDTDKACELSVPVPADAPRGAYAVRIVDDMRGIWHVGSHAGRVVLDCSRAPTLANYHADRLFFRVPEGVRRFKLTITGGHRGEFGLGVFDADGQSRGFARGMRSQQMTPEGQRALDIEVPPGKDGSVWSAVVFASMDWDLKMEGIPPYVSATADGWFLPDTKR
jgi:YetA-like protein